MPKKNNYYENNKDNDRFLDRSYLGEDSNKKEHSVKTEYTKDSSDKYFQKDFSKDVFKKNRIALG